MNKIVCIVVACLVLAVTSKHSKWFELDDYTFEKYISEFGKKYMSVDEHNQRESLFYEKLSKIKQHNKDHSKTWKEGVNHFTDRTEEEFMQVLGLNKQLLYSTKYKRDQSFTKKPISHVNPIDVKALPPSVDWRTKGIISAVKDQGMCGSCWTFGTAETIESYWALQSNDLSDLSEQQILDCVPNPDDCGGTGGCNGGTPELAYTKIQSMGGLSSEWTYPYRSYFGQAYGCQFNSSWTVPMVQLDSFVVLPANQYLPVLQHIATTGPLAINVDASSWSNYETGVYNGCNQTNPNIDHVVQLVGYGTDHLLGDYWIVRNSWNPKWGESGFIRLKRNSTPVCGTDITPSEGTGCNNGPPTVTVCGTCGVLFDTSYPIIAKSS